MDADSLGRRRGMHRWFAKYVYWRTGFTHWSSGPGNYTMDSSCPLCCLRSLVARLTGGR
jgi:hypothetical protein